MKKYFLLLLTIFLLTSAAPANSINTDITPENNALTDKEIKAQISKIKTKRIIIANALLLNDFQKEKANEIYSKNFQKEVLLLAQLKKEKEILKSMPKEKKNSIDRKNQRKIIANLEKSIETLECNTDKEFKKVLNRQQRSKFKRLQREIQISDF